DALRAQGRLRTLKAPHGIDFSSNDYLGYARLAHPPGRWLAHSGTASRLLRGNHPIWNEVESALARWHGAEAALVFNSGYSANQGLLSSIITAGDFVASDEFNHASIIDGLRLISPHRVIYRHQDLGQLDSE